MLRTLAFLLQLCFVVATERFDYIVVGAGTAGLVIASRLSENSSVKVAVIEPGDDQRMNPNVTDPEKLDLPINSPLDWQYETTPQTHALNRVLSLPQGKAWGGSSAVNGMTYIRGDASVFNAWERLGNPGWNWSTLLPYFKKSESHTKPNNHGIRGPVHIGYPSKLVDGDFSQTVSKSWSALGLGSSRDLNGGYVHGFAIGPQTLDASLGVRWDSARAYYTPAEKRQNLKIIKGTVRRITWERGSPSSDRRVANGVEYLDGCGKLKKLRASGEVIAAAGSIRTPLVLEASGIGNAHLLKNLGVKTVIDLPGVGEHLIEQPGGLFIFTGTTNGSASALHAFATAKDVFGDRCSEFASQLKSRIPAWSTAIAAASPGQSLNRSAVETQLELQHSLLFNESAAFAEILSASPPGASIIASSFRILFPFSRGRVHLQSSSITNINEPVYDPSILQAELDLAGVVASGQLTRKLWTTDSATKLNIVPVFPTLGDLPLTATDEQWRAWILASAGPEAHSLGSAAMMARELGGVVDSNLMVYGTSSVRVVDASVIPTQISGHLTATVYAIAERAADFIKATW